MVATLHEEVRKQIEQTMLDIYPLWLARPLLDQRRVTRPIGPGQFGIDVEDYAGWRSNSRFWDSAKSRPCVKLLEDCFRAHMPELLGFIRKPQRALKLDALSWAVTWCLYLDTVPGAKADIGVGMLKLLRDLEALLQGVATQRGIILIRGLAVDTHDPDVIVYPGSARLGEVVLHRPSSEEYAEITALDVLQGPMVDFSHLTSFAIAYYRKPIRIDFTTEKMGKNGPNPFEEENRSVADLLSRALHILKPGNVAVVQLEVDHLPRVAPGMGGGISMPPPAGFMHSLAVEDGDVRALQEHFAGLLDCRPEIGVAAGRLVDAENRIHPTEAILDVAIGLETLLNPSATDELTFRVRLNYASLGADRRKRVDELAELFKFRGRIVHGGFDQKRDGGRVPVVSTFGKSALRDTLARFLRDDELRKGPKLDTEFWLNRLLGPAQPN